MQVVILGMHRSGTSLLSGLLDLAGVHFGEESEFIKANEENPKGFRELKEIRGLNDALLHNLGCDWSEISHLSKGLISEAQRIEFLTKAGGILEGLEAKASQNVIGIKEPRFCVLMDYWKQALSPERFFILVHRDPTEIAVSLNNRNGIPENVSAYLIEQYLGHAICSIQQENFCITSFNDLISEPRKQLERILDSIEMATGIKLRQPDGSEIETFVEPALHRSKAKNGKLQISDRLGSWYASLQKGKLPKLQTVVSEVSEQVLSYEHAKRFSEFLALQSRFKVLESQHLDASSPSELKLKLKSAVDKLANCEKKLETNISQKAILQTREHQLSDVLQEARRSIEDKDITITGLQTQLEVLLGESRFVVQQLEKAEQQLLSQSREVSELEKSLAELQGQLVDQAQHHKLREIEVQELTYRESINSAKIETLEQKLVVSDYEKSRKLSLENTQLAKKLDVRTADLSLQKSKLVSVSQSYKNVLEAQKKLANAVAKTDETLDLFFASKTWWLTKKLVRPMLSPLKLGRGYTVLDELETDRIRVKSLNLKFPGTASSNEPRFIESDLSKSVTPQVSIIVLNRDGAEHLESFFSSYLIHHDARLAEFVVVDHASVDSSISVIERYMEQLPLKLIACTENYSFAHSNNYASRFASGDQLIFSNNDIIFDQPVVNELLSELEDPEAGLVGLPLFYAEENGKRSSRLQHAGISFHVDEQFDFMRPVNKQTIADDGKYIKDQPVVTAALLACRKSDFVKAGMFHEQYNYGYEDVDLCLTFRTKLGLKSVLTNRTSAIHDESSSQKKDAPTVLSERRKSNIGLLRRRFGHYLEKQRVLSKLDGGQWTRNPLRVGFVVTDDDPDTKAGDLFTAMELAENLKSEFGWECSYLPQLSKTKDWYDLSNLDCIIVLIDNYDLSKIHSATCRVIKVAWLRNWFDRWTQRPWFNSYDLCLCSSQKACDFVEETSGKQAHVLKIATNINRFNAETQSAEEYKSDYCFTGSYWKSPREIENFQPQNLPYEFAIYGVGWEKHKHFSDSLRGSIPYRNIPLVYASSKILIDDANHVTKPWGSVNSRVFDALAAGLLVITNGEIGAEETFAGLLPVYHSQKDLEEKIRFYMENPNERLSLINQLQSMVVDNHTYKSRAYEFRDILRREVADKTRIAIKLPVPRIEEVEQWGDYHLGKGLAKSFTKMGYSVRLDIIPDWYTKRPIPDDVVLTIRGLSRYEPDERHLNLMWQISHPEKVDDEEYEQYDQVFVASEKYAGLLSERLSTPVSVMLQCTDPSKFKFDPNRIKNDKIVFVGNSRKQFRPIVKDAIDAGLDLVVYGTLWEKFIDRKYIAGQHISNDDLGDFYASSGVVLNDHWETMSKNGFMSNRLFDASACGAVVVSDEVQGIGETFKGLVYTYSEGPAELLECITSALSESDETKKSRSVLAKQVAERHSFDARAKDLSAIIVRKSIPFKGLY